MRLYVEDGLTPVACRQLRRPRSLVKKNSRKHTSVQWTSDGVAALPGDRRAGSAADARGAQCSAAPKLKASIEDAVRTGDVVVPDA